MKCWWKREQPCLALPSAKKRFFIRGMEWAAGKEKKWSPINLSFIYENDNWWVSLLFPSTNCSSLKKQKKFNHNSSFLWIRKERKEELIDWRKQLIKESKDKSINSHQLLIWWVSWFDLIFFAFPQRRSINNSKIFWLLMNRARQAERKPFNSFLLFCLAQRESKKKRELMGLPRSGAAWCSIHKEKNNPFLSFTIDFINREEKKFKLFSLCSFIIGLLISWFHQLIGLVLFFSRSVMPAGRP